MEYLLLIFRKWPETGTYWLINRPGLPVSRNSPLIHNTPADPMLIPDLLASLTETLTSDLAVYSGYQFMNTWSTTTPESKPKPTDYFVLLERHTPTNKPKPQTQNQDEAEAKSQVDARSESPKRRDTIRCQETCRA
ncbi:hypothetical protein ALT_8205 [Aspergillus lentulus]|uniref:Uncharacterized protein n=1 Tax=Aspergillus lentulus TaxID=293939 RepID=A0AAN4PRD0_ASPLE|nr:uncharacterized protein IFM58399_07208 [Aspergillus lentulus]KAF4156261.1 hypothetical protein CNMCM6069_007026 [Aspergillus lentulus]KAF4184312.1 hypothetical protein CNMCM7927_008122 [Aspergillus lentulus]GAQ10884.1 hypothetical protein ALT_8205 [Aspergillus lentulus]GFF44206.1 hypothetical protein IFM58399_07208 [Aspergillus lentulus]GFF52963.1 hypothetical protein IFM62136_02186 [Aspergillus lentulus]